ncbi:MAG: hypothetical protein JW881_04280 [Spirochaetales bacterium]|nr:hypothetical protein [Spirochaetales bacterium]
MELSWPFFMGIGIFIITTLVGLLTWSSSDIPLAIREIAINSRKERVRGPFYVSLKIKSISIKIFAALIWICGFLLAFWVVYNKAI